MLINTATQERIQVHDFKALYPDTSFPIVLTDEMLEPFGFAVLNYPANPVMLPGETIADVGQEFVNNEWRVIWQITSATAEAIQAKKEADQRKMIDAIKAERDRRKAGGVKLTIGGVDYWFWTDDPSRSQYAMLDSMARRNNLPEAYKIDDWKTMSGVKVPFTVQVMHNVIDAGIAQEGLLFHAAENHVEAMLLEDNPLTYIYNSGWPQSYQESLTA